MKHKSLKSMSLSRTISAVLLSVSSVGMMTDANATSSIAAQYGLTNCAICHTQGAFSKTEGKAGLAAYLASLNPTPAPTPKPTATPTPKPTTTPTPRPTSTPIPTPTTGYSDDDHDDDHDEYKGKKGKSSDKPKVTAPKKVSVRSGSTVKVDVIGSNSTDNDVSIKATKLPKGATIENTYDAALQLPKAVISYTPPVNSTENKSIVVKAVDSESGIASVPTTIAVEVLPAQTSAVPADDAVKTHAISSAKFSAKSKAVSVSGVVAWNKSTTKAERKALVSEESVAITDATTGAALGSATATADGKWKTTIATDGTNVPSSIDASFHDVHALKSVSKTK